MKDDRYQYQTRFVKCCRWLRWKPLYSVIAVWAILRWLLTSRQVPFWHRPGCFAYVKFIWKLYLGMAATGMRHVYTIEEIVRRMVSEVR
jgi:hypothetical protein